MEDPAPTLKEQSDREARLYTMLPSDSPFLWFSLRVTRKMSKKNSFLT